MLFESAASGLVLRAVNPSGLLQEFLLDSRKITQEPAQVIPDEPLALREAKQASHVPQHFPRRRLGLLPPPLEDPAFGQAHASEEPFDLSESHEDPRRS